MTRKTTPLKRFSPTATQPTPVPDDGCTTYRALFEGLERFERELHEHVHLENNVLFPRVVSLNARAGARRAPGVGAH